MTATAATNAVLGRHTLFVAIVSRVLAKVSRYSTARENSRKTLSSATHNHESDCEEILLLLLRVLNPKTPIKGCWITFDIPTTL